MGVDVQKEMRLNAVSHIIARDVDDKSSKKLEHARKWAHLVWVSWADSAYAAVLHSRFGLAVIDSKLYVMQARLGCHN